MSRQRPGFLSTPFILVSLLGVLLSAPTLLNGFGLDDYLHIASIEQWYPEKEPSLNLYSDFLECPYLPWFTYPEMNISFWRPLTSALLRLDYGLFGRNAAPYHVHSLLWLLALFAVCRLLFTRLPKTVGTIALLLFALDECHAMNAGYIANRHGLIASVPALLGLYMHLRWREDQWRPGLPLSILGYIVGLLGGETAFSVLAYVLAYEIWASPKDSSIRQRFAGVSPATLLAGIYVVTYKFMDFGASGSGYYLDPTGQPFEFLAGASRHIPVLLGAMLTAFPADLWMIPQLRQPQLAVSVVSIFVGLAWLAIAWKSLSDDLRRCVKWYGGGALGSLLPMAAAQPADRQLLVPAIGISVGLAVVLTDAWRRVLSTQNRSHWRGWVAGSIMGLLVLIHCGLAPASRLASQYMFGKITPSIADVAVQIPATGGSPTSFFLINAPDLFTALYVPVFHDYHRGANSMSWTALSMAPFDHHLLRTGPRTLELQVLDGQMLGSDAEQVIRPLNQELHPGDEVHHQDLFDIKILESNDVGPTRIAFEFHQDLDHPTWQFLTWSDTGLSTVQTPGIGQSIYLNQALGPVRIR